MGTAPTAPPIFAFVDRIRFVAIALIVVGHAGLAVGAELNDLTADAPSLFYSLLKFDIIAMYLVSGFLMGDAVGRSRSYLLGRVRRTALPWLAWVGMVSLPGAGALLLSGAGVPAYLGLLGTMTFQTSYWFIPNYLFGLAFMFLVLRWLPPGVTGLILGLSSLVYGVNLYTEWFTSQHTVAWFGFMFYLWLGAWARRHWPEVQARLSRVPWFHVLPVVVLTGLGVAAETAYLQGRGSLDAANALKLSNHLYSVAWCVLLVVCPWRLVPAFIDSRRESFGIYLAHIVPLTVLGLAFRALGWPAPDLGPWGQLAAWFATGAAGYLLSALLVKGLVRAGFGWVVGDLSDGPPAPRSRAFSRPRPTSAAPPRPSSGRRRSPRGGVGRHP
ncbi:Acyltransferase family protein [Deinococcus reticulitermitis]|uniref:Acyltransferase family protein n=1 Tax=Deinococcus reticulitermitis TaxID=856736 RepID=A0A1H6XMK0_9DEIO|nr:Acyltransferase family protein [Deinococcus reticulitermitis]